MFSKFIILIHYFASEAEWLVIPMHSEVKCCPDKCLVSVWSGLWLKCLNMIAGLGRSKCCMVVYYLSLSLRVCMQLLSAPWTWSNSDWFLCPQKWESCLAFISGKILSEKGLLGMIAVQLTRTLAYSARIPLCCIRSLPCRLAGMTQVSLNFVSA